jgi:hypothetical protein
LTIQDASNIIELIFQESWNILLASIMENFSMRDNKYPIERNLDGIYFRIERDGKYINRCFSDLTDKEQTESISRYDNAALQRICKLLAGVLRDITDRFVIAGVNDWKGEE